MYAGLVVLRRAVLSVTARRELWRLFDLQRRSPQTPLFVHLLNTLHGELYTYVLFPALAVLASSPSSSRARPAIRLRKVQNADAAFASFSLYIHSITHLQLAAATIRFRTLHLVNLARPGVNNIVPAYSSHLTSLCANIPYGMTIQYDMNGLRVQL